MKTNVGEKKLNQYGSTLNTLNLRRLSFSFVHGYYPSALNAESVGLLAFVI